MNTLVVKVLSHQTKVNHFYLVVLNSEVIGFQVLVHHLGFLVKCVNCIEHLEHYTHNAKALRLARSSRGLKIFFDAELDELWPDYWGIAEKSIAEILGNIFFKTNHCGDSSMFIILSVEKSGGIAVRYASHLECNLVIYIFLFMEKMYNALGSSTKLFWVDIFLAIHEGNLFVGFFWRLRLGLRRYLNYISLHLVLRVNLSNFHFFFFWIHDIYELVHRRNHWRWLFFVAVFLLVLLEGLLEIC